VKSETAVVIYYNSQENYLKVPLKVVMNPLYRELILTLAHIKLDDQMVFTKQLR
jgi:hypothetical protein